MNKVLARKKLIKYFKKNQIPYQYINESEKIKKLDDIDTIYLCTEIEMVIGGYVEASIRLFDDYMYLQTYFCQPIANTEEEQIRAARFANYLNSSVSYDCDDLYSPIYIVDCEGDFYRGILIRYELFEEYLYETMDHILNFSVQQLAESCIPLIFYLSGEVNFQEATSAVKTHVFRGQDLRLIYK